MEAILSVIWYIMQRHVIVCGSKTAMSPRNTRIRISDYSVIYVVTRSFLEFIHVSENPCPRKKSPGYFVMHGDKADQTSIAQRQAALSRWDNEGGALSRSAIQTGAETPVLTNAELVLLRIRVIALENLVISLLAGGSDGQLDIARELASHISPRSGAKHHLLTVEAARHMMDLVKRAFNFRPASSS